MFDYVCTVSQCQCCFRFTVFLHCSLCIAQLCYSTVLQYNSANTFCVNIFIRVCVLLSRRSQQRERLSASVLSICSFVCLSVTKIQKNAIFSKTKQFRAMVAIDYLQEVVHGLFKKNHYCTLKIQGGGDPPSWILTQKCKNAILSKTKQFRAMVSIDDLYRKSFISFSKNPLLDP